MSPIVVILLALLIGCGTPLAVLFILWWANRERERHPGQYAAWLEENPLPHSPYKPPSGDIMWDTHARMDAWKADIDVDTTKTNNDAIDICDPDYIILEPGNYRTGDNGWTIRTDDLHTRRRRLTHRR